MLKKRIGLLCFIRNIIISIMQTSKLIKNKLVVELNIPVGTNNTSMTLQNPIIPNNHSIPFNHALSPTLQILFMRLTVLQHQLHPLIFHMQQLQKLLLKLLPLILSSFLPPVSSLFPSIIKN